MSDCFLRLVENVFDRRTPWSDPERAKRSLEGEAQGCAE